MDPDSFAFSLLTIVVLLMISGFAAASETAFFSLNRFQIRKIRERYKSSFEKMKTLLARPTRFLILILLLNELVNIALAALITRLTHQHSTSIIALFPEHWQESFSQSEDIVTGIVSLFITVPLILIVGEITPKVVAAKMNRFVATLHSPVLYFLYKLLFPFLWATDAMVSLFLRRFKAEGKDHLTKTMSTLTEDDFMILMKEGHREGSVDADERKLVENVLDLDDETVSQVMTPLSKVFSLSASSTIREVLPEVRTQKFSRIPVYQKSKKSVVGILYVKDLLFVQSEPEVLDAQVRTLMSKKLLTTTSNTRLSVLFKKLKQGKAHIAICLDAKGEAIGVVTMEDVLESIFGAIQDERDLPTEGLK